MPPRSEKQRRMMCAEATRPGSTKARGISRKSAMEYCRGKVTGKKKRKK